jgi:regulator of protease activity HflC (stomatin/prohibitin superfamily)
MKTNEIRLPGQNGWPMVVVLITGEVLLGCFVLLALFTASPFAIVLSLVAISLWTIGWNGFYMLQPNEAAVLMLFGSYRGTVTEPGLRWTHPFFMKRKVSLRARNMNNPPIKVNDLRGNPIEIGAVVVWRVEDTAKAVFDVESFEKYVSIQVESALRHLAMAYPYDSFESGEFSLRGSTDEVSQTLCKEIQERAACAGVTIAETRLSHLAYAPEIAGAMLQRQQADAVVAARTRIVEGATGMVQLALEKLTQQGVIDLDEERKAAMVTNLMVVLCAHEPARPIINAGTLYS